MWRKNMLFLFTAAFILILAACGSSGAEDEDDEIASEGGQYTASVDMINSEEEEAGTAEIVQAEDGNVTIQLDLSGLPADSTHGIHLHQTGECTAPDFESAGDHFNPTDAEHGTDSEGGPHVGDLPNIETDENGEVTTELDASDEIIVDRMEDNSLFDDDNTALVVHENADDYETQPSGDSGDRIACGVVE
ncbi:Cu-Zn family superoxide dismutase [Sinobaca qinghaiensis]|uniref:Superoxide dismutase [Cu-Zn] n=1 Tax=Sinobaca qinghaiensis TaxID=342944 RepID=A0A419V8N6_9BACL|nr:superoxide dismutase family protein [Sinobaca qinghaiensis]RKD76461.1 Cu-Zn family superoxide dismutase [Sinobaca qinghaiensis]